KRHETLKVLAKSYTDQLNDKRETIRKLAETVGSDDRQTLALREQYAMEHLQYLQTELLNIQSQKRKLESQLRTMGLAEGDESGTTSPISERTVDQLVEKHPEIDELAARLDEYRQKLRTEWDQMNRMARKPAVEPSVVRLKKAVNSYEQLLAKRRE